MNEIATTTQVIEFANENLIWGNLGKIAVIVSIFSALFASLGFYINQKNSDLVWKKQATIALYTHVFSVLAIIGILFWMILNHYYEYNYVYQHSSNELPKHYMISCFWEGQEGSFLLWMFWHAMLSLVLVRQRSELTTGALSVLTLAQFMLGTMLLGISIGDITVGSSPFDLLRDKAPDLLQLPVLQSIGMENYLQVIKDGTGLNPLLQNYWMVIHPPTLFLGFAAAIVPFGFVVAHFWNKKRQVTSEQNEVKPIVTENWIRQALPWTLFTVMILGAGIIMGGFWAYESLSFGGYWAWDPVENASLMPWIIAISGVHILLITKNTGRYSVLSIILLCFSFFFVLYATFLTRSGVLGDASVHSFTDLGLSGQLLFFIFLFVWVGINSTSTSLKAKLGLFSVILIMFGIYFYIPSNIGHAINTFLFFGCIAWWVFELNKHYKVKNEEDHIWSREFWMFIGSLVLILSAFQIIFYTSTPVFNKLFGSTLAVQKPEFYNRYHHYNAHSFRSIF
jgi:cytochrome c-type biogenesis protein CcmF